MAIDIFQSLKNCVFDLQRADVQNYQQPLKQLARLLNSENLQSVNAHLTRNVELDTFLARSEDTESSMAGSAVLQWPDEPADILGLKLLLIEKMADDNNFSFNFCHTFFYDRNIIESIRKFTSSLVAPFVRDYQLYVENQHDPEPAVFRPVSRKIFIVHGHDNDALQSVARFISRIWVKRGRSATARTSLNTSATWDGSSRSRSSMTTMNFRSRLTSCPAISARSFVVVF